MNDLEFVLSFFESQFFLVKLGLVLLPITAIIFAAMTAKGYGDVLTKLRNSFKVIRWLSDYALHIAIVICFTGAFYIHELEKTQPSKKETYSMQEFRTLALDLNKKTLGFIQPHNQVVLTLCLSITPSQSSFKDVIHIKEVKECFHRYFLNTKMSVETSKIYRDYVMKSIFEAINKKNEFSQTLLSEMQNHILEKDKEFKKKLNPPQEATKKND